MTARPTLQPVPPPTTSIPSAQPSITGLIATFDVSRTVTEALSQEEVSAIEAEVMSNFDVSAEDLSTTGTDCIIKSPFEILSHLFHKRKH